MMSTPAAVRPSRIASPAAKSLAARASRRASINTSTSSSSIVAVTGRSRSAARAAADALPFLRRAKVVEVVTVASEPAKSDEMPGADIAQHLARHGVTVELKRIVTAETDVASTILSHAADSSADFLVMGGYGHSRLREFILGGVTREILASMTVPVLMSH